MKNTISPKVTAAALAAAGVTILSWLLGMLGLDVPTAVEGALAVFATFGAGYLVPDPMRATLLDLETAQEVETIEDDVAP